jgi:hypothetical protein
VGAKSKVLNSRMVPVWVNYKAITRVHEDLAPGINGPNRKCVVKAGVLSESDRKRFALYSGSDVTLSRTF